MMIRLARYVAERLRDPRRRPRTVFWISLLVFALVMAWRAVVDG